MSAARYSRADRARHDWLELQAHALTVACPRCQQAIERPCVNPLTGQPLAAPAHPPRIAAADKAGRLAHHRAHLTGGPHAPRQTTR